MVISLMCMRRNKSGGTLSSTLSCRRKRPNHAGYSATDGEARLRLWQFCCLLSQPLPQRQRHQGPRHDSFNLITSCLATAQHPDDR
jgi:hypothetical protein